MEKEKKSLIENFKGLSKKKKIVLITIATLIVISLIAVGISSLVSNINEKTRQEQLAIEEANKVTVPNLVGMTYKEAKEEIEKLELTVDTYRETPNDDDIVISQTPSAEKRISKGEKVTLSLKTPLTIKSDTSLTGATFKKTWTELKRETDELYKEKYNQDIHISKGEKVQKTDTNQTDTEYIIFMFYTYSTYNINEKAYISVNVDDATDNVIGITYSYIGNIDENSLTIYLKILDFVSDNLSSEFSEYIKQISNAQKQGNDINNPDVLTYYKDNVYIWSNQYNNQTNMLTMAAKDSEVEYHKQYGKWREVENNTTTETNSSKVAEIEQMIGFLNSYYDLGFNPTDEQMQEIIEFSNTTDNFNNDTLFEYIGQKGWTVRGTGTIDNNSGTTSNSNNSSNNTNQNSSDTNTSSTYEEIKATLSINIKDLINSSTDPEVKTILQSNTLQVSIFVDGSLEESKSKMYHGGIDSIPNTITEDFTFDVTKNKSIKSNVRIVIDNTSTMIRESTLYDKSITFDKTGTYTIK